MIILLAFGVILEFFVLQAYPSAEGLALEIGIICWFVMFGILIMVVCIAFKSRNINKVNSQKVILLGAAIDTYGLFAVIMSMTIFRGIPLNILPMIATGTLAMLSFWSLSKPI